MSIKFRGKACFAMVAGVLSAGIIGIFLTGGVAAAQSFYWLECDVGGLHGNEYIIYYGTEAEMANWSTSNFKDTMVVRFNSMSYLGTDFYESGNPCRDTFGGEDDKPFIIQPNGSLEDALGVLRIAATQGAVGATFNVRWGKDSIDGGRMRGAYEGMNNDPLSITDYNDLMSIFISTCEAGKLVGNPPTSTTNDGLFRFRHSPETMQTFYYYQIWVKGAGGQAEKAWYIFENVRNGDECFDMAKRLGSNELRDDLVEKIANGEEIVAGEEISQDVIDIISPNAREGPLFMTQEQYEDCKKSAGTFSWVVCPLLDWVLSVVDGTFNIIEKFLAISPSILATEGENVGVYTGWQAFRDMANIVLVIIFIILIISQVTGFGIDNYGIKKMLPRLIVLAILINLSFIVCQLAVDLSNIVGSNVYNFLKYLAGNLGFSSTTSTAGATGIVAVFVAIVGVIIAAIINPVVLLPLLLTVVGGVISVLFMFLLLGVRQAAAAIFVILAPLAFAMNILPNTAGLFKKWLSIFKVLLLLYPICALVMGGSLYGAMLLMSINPGAETIDGKYTIIDENDVLGFIFGIVALVLIFAPIFFIPKLVKGAFDSLGKVGAAIGGLGGRLGNFAKGKVENSERYKDAPKRGADYRNKRVVDKLGDKIDRGKNLSDYKKRKYARALKANVKATEEDGNLDNITSQGYRGATMQKVDDSVFDNEVAIRQTALQNDRSFMRDITDPSKIAESAVIARFSTPGVTDETKIAMLTEMAKTKEGMAQIRELNRVSNGGLGGNLDRLGLKNAMARQGVAMGAINKRAGDVGDFFNKTSMTMQQATDEYTFRGEELGEMDNATIMAIAKAGADSYSTSIGAPLTGEQRLHAAAQQIVDSDQTAGIKGAAQAYLTGKTRQIQAVDVQNETLKVHQDGPVDVNIAGQNAPVDVNVVGQAPPLPPPKIILKP